jgi:hypothetical protein
VGVTTYHTADNIVFRNVALSGAPVYSLGPSGPFLRVGTGSPEGAISAPVGSLFLRTDGGATSTLYVKETGAGNTGWAAK